MAMSGPVWALMADGSYAEGRYDGGEEGGKIGVELGDGSRKLLPAADVLPVNPGPAVPDLTTMVVLNEATILNNVRERYLKNRIYTRAANMLVAVNPGHLIPELYTDATRTHTKGADLRDPRLEPHLYDVAEQAYRQLEAKGKPQSIVISGESGAGKTESIKYTMNYLVWRSSENSKAGGAGAAGEQLTTRIMQSNPLLEALGNAKTQRNHNSSRFGKYITLQFDVARAIVGAQIHTFLLEKSRVTNTDAEKERSYHVFYQLVAGHPLMAGKSCQDFRTLSLSGTTTVPGVNDAAQFKNLQVALGWFGIEATVQEGLWQVLAGALYLGNVAFEGDEEATVTQATQPSLALAERYLGVQQLRKNLLTKTIVTAGESIEMTLKPADAAKTRDALIKQMYARVFDHMVFAINAALMIGQDKKASSSIGLLDVFGFEWFKKNSFEQLCINYANERLHAFFMQQVFVDELALYTREGIPVPAVNPPNNAEVCEIFDKPRVGAFDLLDSQSRAPKPNDSAFCRELYASHGANTYFGTQDGKVSEEIAKLKLRIDEAFVVHHFAASVVYCVDGFLDKNDNKLSDAFEASLRLSKQPYIAAIIQSEGAGATGASLSYVPNLAAPSGGGGGKMAPPPMLPGSGFSSVGKTFLNDLRKLMRELEATQPHFVRCLKPNEELAPRQMDGKKVLQQMQASGLMEAIKLMQASYPSRSTYEELLRVFGTELPKSIRGTSPAQQVEILLYGTSAEPHEYLLGKQLVFFTREAGRVLDELRATPVAQIRPRMVSRLKAKGSSLTQAEKALLAELEAAIKAEILERARRRKEAIFIAVYVAIKLKRRSKRSQARRKLAATKVEAAYRAKVGRTEGMRRKDQAKAMKRIRDEEARRAKMSADAQAAAAAAEAAAAEAEAEAAELEAAEALALAEAEAEAAIAAAELAAAEAEAEAAAWEADAEAEAAAHAAHQKAATSQAARARAETTSAQAAHLAETAAALEEPAQIGGMIEVQGVRCFRTLKCTGGSGIFQRHNFEGLWLLSEGEEISGGHAHYEHHTPNGQMVHLFHVNSAYGGVPRWVIGPVPGNENGWGFVDTTASHPEIISEKWMVWMETSWEESKRLTFKAVAGDDEEGLEDDEEEDDDDDLAEFGEGLASSSQREVKKVKKKKKGKKAGGAKKAGAKKESSSKKKAAPGASATKPSKK